MLFDRCVMSMRHFQCEHPATKLEFQHNAISFVARQIKSQFSTCGYQYWVIHKIITFSHRCSVVETFVNMWFSRTWVGLQYKMVIFIYAYNRYPCGFRTYFMVVVEYEPCVLVPDPGASVCGSLCRQQPAWIDPRSHHCDQWEFTGRRPLALSGHRALPEERQLHSGSPHSALQDQWRVWPPWPGLWGKDPSWWSSPRGPAGGTLGSTVLLFTVWLFTEMILNQNKGKCLYFIFYHAILTRLKKIVFTKRDQT